MPGLEGTGSQLPGPQQGKALAPQAQQQRPRPVVVGLLVPAHGPRGHVAVGEVPPHPVPHGLAPGTLAHVGLQPLRPHVGDEVGLPEGVLGRADLVPVVRGGEVVRPGPKPVRELVLAVEDEIKVLNGVDHPGRRGHAHDEGGLPAPVDQAVPGVHGRGEDAPLAPLEGDLVAPLVPHLGQPPALKNEDSLVVHVPFRVQGAATGDLGHVDSPLVLDGPQHLDEGPGAAHAGPRLPGDRRHVMHPGLGLMDGNPLLLHPHLVGPRDFLLDAVPVLLHVSSSASVLLGGRMVSGNRQPGNGPPRGAPGAPVASYKRPLTRVGPPEAWCTPRPLSPGLP